MEDHKIISLLANSLWLDNGFPGYVPDTIDTLAQQYYASVFCGDLGTPEMDEALCHWPDEQTALGDVHPSKKADVLLRLPQFDISSKQDLNAQLHDLGVTDVFHAGTFTTP